VRRLLLVEPWGFPARPDNPNHYSIPLWIRAIGAVMSPFNPLAGLRLAGPLGQNIFTNVPVLLVYDGWMYHDCRTYFEELEKSNRPQIEEWIELMTETALFELPPVKGTLLPQVRCWSRLSGRISSRSTLLCLMTTQCLTTSTISMHRHPETAFRNMTIPYGWAKRPMLERIDGVRADIPISFIYGSRSSIDSNSGYAVKKTRPDVEIIVGGFKFFS
ncbi:hypothetical protein XENOCAPTIV_003311, partial [Xenoophorus captivus]